MPLGEWHRGGDLHAAISGQLARIGVAEEGVGELALLRAVHCYPQGGIRNIANWVCQAHGSRIIPVCSCGMHAALCSHSAPYMNILDEIRAIHVPGRASL